jgi:hypothetical protein
MRTTIKEAARSKYLPEDYGYWYVHLEFCPTHWQMPIESMNKAFIPGFNDRLLNHWKNFIGSLGFTPSWIQSFTDGFQAGFQTQDEANRFLAKLKSFE